VRRFALLALTVLTALAVAVAPAIAKPKKPKPRLGHTVVVMATDGHPTVKPPHKKRMKLKKGKALAVPVGSTVDATSGHVKLTSAKRYGGTQDGTFSQGAFVVTQGKSDDLTNLTLAGGNFGVCSAAARARKPVVGAANKRRRLFGHAHGHFRTRGRNSSATVRGTEWLTEDRCTGTVVVNKSPNKTSKVETSTNQIHFDLDPGQTATGYCNKFVVEPDTYCIMLLAQPADGLIGAGIITQVDRPNYALCVKPPTGDLGCSELPFYDRNADGWRLGVVACPVPSPGDYQVGWSLDYTVDQSTNTFYINSYLFPAPLTLHEDVAGPQINCIINPPQQ
jgi:hypothetical protein